MVVCGEGNQDMCIRLIENKKRSFGIGDVKEFERKVSIVAFHSHAFVFPLISVIA